MDTKTILAIMFVTSSVGLCQASEWWEREFATLQVSGTSPDGCIRLDNFRPFWVLPSVFHPIPGIDGTYDRPGMIWDAPTFARAYEASTGEFLGETITYDGAATVGGVYWGDPSKVGQRKIHVGGYPLPPTDRCADAATLAKLYAARDAKNVEDKALGASWRRGQ